MSQKKKKWATILNNEPHKLGHALGYNKLVVDHGAWIKYIWGDNLSNEERAIQAHRNSYKTTSIDIVGAMWRVLFNPQDTILIVREELSNAIAIVIEITDKYKNPNMLALYHEFYGIHPFEFKRESQKSIVLPTKLEMTREGNIDAAGLGTSYTGRHYKHIHTDDIVTLKDRVSKAKRVKTLHAVRELRNLMDLETGRLSHTGTPWHRDDAWNYIPNILKFPIGAVKIPAIIKNLDAAIKHFREGTTNSLFSANYLLKHVASDDSIFKEPNWLDSMPENYQPRAHIDAGYKGKNTTALTLIEYDQERDRYLGTGFVWDKNIIDNFDQIGKTLNDPRWKIGTLYIEDNADKGFSAKEIRAHHGVVSEYHESMNKHVKIVTFALKYWHKIWWTPATDPAYLSQILDYIEGDEPDDACLTADTKIITLSGNKNISDIKKGEHVLTPLGFKRVLFSGCTGFKNVITRGDLTGTKSHKIFIKDKFISLDSYTDLLSYDKISLKRYLSWQIIKECYLMEYGMRKQGRAGIISLAKYRIKKEGSLNNCIKLFGNFITKKMCQKATIFIIKILIKTITALIIWNYLKAANIYQYILKRILNPKNTGINLKKILIKSGRLLKSGIAVKKAWNGIIDMLKIPWLRPGHLEKKGYVFTAVKNIQQNVINKNIAVKNAATDYGKEDSQKKENVLNVGANSLFQKKVLKNIVRRNAVIKQDIKGKYPVFNLTVKDAGVFYANNILVSNCDSYASLMREFDSSAGIVTDAIGGGGDLDYILSGDDRER